GTIARSARHARPCRDFRARPGRQYPILVKRMRGSVWLERGRGGWPQRARTPEDDLSHPIGRNTADAATAWGWRGDLRHTRRDGTEIFAAAHKVLRRDEHGEPVALMESLADVTALRVTQARLQELTQTLRTKVHEEVEARQAAQLRAAQ